MKKGSTWLYPVQGHHASVSGRKCLSASPVKWVVGGGQMLGHFSGRTLKTARCCDVRVNGSSAEIEMAARFAEMFFRAAAEKN